MDLSRVKKFDPRPYPFTEFQLEWLDALESGKYKQGQGVLCSVTHEYCCLGVLAELAGAHKQLHISGKAYLFGGINGVHYETGAMGHLIFPVREKAHLISDTGALRSDVFFPGLKYAEEPYQGALMPFKYKENEYKIYGHRSLAAMNDVRMIPDGPGFRALNFKEIAAYIRHDPWNVFHDPRGAELLTDVPEFAEGAMM